MKKQKNRNLMIFGIAMLAMIFAGNNAFAVQAPLSENYVENRTDNDEEPNCTSGGCGTLACSIGGGISIFKIGANIQQGVSCESGYYACCNISHSHCFNSSNCPTVDDIEEVDD